jgi:glycosyltransferase involved in cell wall biosynthesis
MMGGRRARFGIVTPSFNQGSFIGETIESVLGQGYPDLDYRVVDGASTDGTLDVLAGYGPRLRWTSEPDGGQAQAINKGLRMIGDADIVAFINSDDVYLPGAFSAVARYFEEHADACWLTGDHFIVDAAGRTIQRPVAAYKRALRRRPTLRRLAIANYIVQPSTFWRRKLLDEVGFFDETLRYCFDYDFWMRAIARHPLHTIRQPLSLFRIHGRSKGGSQFAAQFAEEHAVLRRHTGDRALLALHRLHAGLIVFAYGLMKV